MEKDKYSIFLQEQNRGRIDLTGFNGKPFNLSQDLGINKNRDVGDSIKNIHQETLTSRAFFSKTNFEHLQKEIINGVYKRSNNQYKINRQSDTELEIVMRSIYLQHTQSLPCGINEQIMKLNSLVLDYCVPQILGEVSQYYKYLNDISQPIPTFDRPTNVSIKGEKTLTPNLGFVGFTKK